MPRSSRKNILLAVIKDSTSIAKTRSKRINAAKHPEEMNTKRLKLSTVYSDTQQNGIFLLI